MTLQFLASLLDPNIFQGSGLFLFSLVITGLSIFTLHYLFILQTSFNLQILLKKKTGHFFLSGFLITNPCNLFCFGCILVCKHPNF